MGYRKRSRFRVAFKKGAYANSVAYKSSSSGAASAVRRLRPSTKKAVRAIAKSVINKRSETKSYIATTGTLAPTDGNVYANNLIYPIAQGTTSTTMIGEKMFIKNITFRLMAYTQPGTGSGATLVSTNDKFLRVMVIRTPQALCTTSLSGTSITNTNVFRTSTFLPLSHVDFKKVTLLSDKTYKLPAVPTGTTSFRQLNVNFKVDINSDHSYTQDNSGFLKHGNYYLIYGAYDVGGSSSPVQLLYTWAVNYQDS